MKYIYEKGKKGITFDHIASFSHWKANIYRTPLKVGNTVNVELHQIYDYHIQVA